MVEPSLERNSREADPGCEGKKKQPFGFSFIDHFAHSLLIFIDRTYLCFSDLAVTVIVIKVRAGIMYQ